MTTCINGHTAERDNSGRCPVCTKIRYTRWYSENKAKKQASDKRWRQANPEMVAAGSSRYRKNNPEKRRLADRARKAAKRQNRPKWADMRNIREIYAHCPDDHVVDHVIPLHGKTVCGLHVEINLQYLTAEENAAKSNLFY
jgi:hypothetical protein